ncbi:hypothetical protein F511_45678 [Dorcoceras hygrometricum]|uniref:Uncharacterized protein n=1 Tax=Dorcoceras hygrometricum TaxID=472368 RepID=A0A2Z7A2V9_9LAMI|nr:hypothetical protein F511_45678 [Dorcoceras hygrometricum]
MTSSVTSSYSADDLKEQSQDSAGSLHPDARGSDVVEELFSRKLLFISRCYPKIAIAKRCRLHKLIRQRFAIAIKIQQEEFALIISADEATVDPVATQRHPVARKFRRSFWTTRRKQQQHPVESLFESAVANQPVTQPVASFAYSVDLVPRRKELKKKQSAAVVGINQQRSS